MLCVFLAVKAHLTYLGEFCSLNGQLLSYNRFISSKLMVKISSTPKHHAFDTFKEH